MKIFFRLFVFAFLFLLAGCVPAELHLRELPPDDPHAPVIVAALLPLTGENRIYAEQMQEGLLAAQARINRYGINGRQLRLEIIDTRGSSDGSAEALRIANERQAIAAVVGYNTEEVSLLIPHAAALQMPMIIPMATSDYHLQVSPFIYRNCFSDTQQMEVLANYLIHWRQKQRGAIITDPASDDEYTRGIARNFTQAITDGGGTITMNMALKPDALLTMDQLRSMLMTDPQYILVASRSQRAAQLVKQLRDAGFNGILAGPDCWDDDEFFRNLAGVETGECIFTAFFSDENTSLEFRNFRREFRKKFLHHPGACETQSYDALIFLAIALDDAQDMFKFDRNWRTIRNHHGASGLYTMLKKGDIDRTVYLKSIGVDRRSGTPMPYPRLSKKLQHSDLKNYKVIE